MKFAHSPIIIDAEQFTDINNPPEPIIVANALNLSRAIDIHERMKRLKIDEDEAERFNLTEELCKLPPPKHSWRGMEIETKTGTAFFPPPKERTYHLPNHTLAHIGCWIIKNSSVKGLIAFPVMLSQGEYTMVQDDYLFRKFFSETVVSDSISIIPPDADSFSLKVSDALASFHNYNIITSKLCDSNKYYCGRLGELEIDMLKKAGYRVSRLEDTNEVTHVISWGSRPITDPDPKLYGLKPVEKRDGK